MRAVRQTFCCVGSGTGMAHALLKPWYSRQVHHRSLHPVAEPLRWLRGLWRHAVCQHRERGLLAPLTQPGACKRWFLVPLQVHDDSQVQDHSRFAGMLDFLDEVVASFATHAPADALLVVKHHPMDRAYTDYTAHIEALRQRHGLGARLRYVHDLHLPTLLQHARGVVTINSTVGLQSLWHGTPVITLGESVYQIPGLVFDGALADFWQAPGEVDRPLYERFRAHLIASSQLNASFYAKRPALQPAAPWALTGPVVAPPAAASASVAVAWSSARSAARPGARQAADARPDATGQGSASVVLSLRDGRPVPAHAQGGKPRTGAVAAAGGAAPAERAAPEAV
jgi:capsular polysaccharide export protein